ncbi:MAG: helix-turn-helix transcriptional regulator [Candidatus Zixiibacteriota bacterium]
MVARLGGEISVERTALLRHYLQRSIFLSTIFGFSSVAEGIGSLPPMFRPDIHRELLFPAIEPIRALAYAPRTFTKCLVTMPRPTPNAIRYYRRRANLKLYQVAHALGLSSPAHLAHWEHGRKVPTLDNLLKLAAVLKVPVEVLYLERLKHHRRVITERQAMPAKKPL